MNDKQVVEHEQSMGEMAKEKKSREPFIKYIFEENPDNGRTVIKAVGLSDGTNSNSTEFHEKIQRAFKNTTGCDVPEIAQHIISKIAWGMSSGDVESRINNVATLLYALQPQDESEALLLGQFLALQDSGLACLRNANCNEMFFHKQELFRLSVKLLRCANETMQTFLRYRSGGKQQIQVIHVSGEAKAIIANEMHGGGG